MSRLNTTQVIALGDYLKPDFNPASLTVGQLLGLLAYHDVQYPTRYTKPILIDLFNAEIKPKAKKLNRERIKRENSQASQDGITDGMTGKPLNEKEKEKNVRRSRRLSKTPAPEGQSEPEHVPPKRRRASAQPSLGGPSRKKAAQPPEPTLVEESEPEEEPVVRKVGRPRKNIAEAGTQARRVSRPTTEDPESGWEDNNVFQSGADSSSPMRPSPVRTRTRKSSASGRPAPKARKSMSAPPQVSSPSPTKDKGKARERSSSIRPPESAFEPELPLLGRQLSVVPDAKEEDDESFPLHEHSPPLASLANTMAEAGVLVSTEGEDEDVDELNGEQQSDENVHAVAQRIADGGQLAKRQASSSSSGSHWLLHLFFSGLLFSTFGFVYQYKQESAQIGFCNAGQNTNGILEGLRAHRVAVESCNRENRTTLYVTDADSTVSVAPPVPTATPSQAHAHPGVAAAEPCPLPPLVPYVQPDECTPCPKHATCSPSSINCENGYILRPHPLLAAFHVPAVQKEGGLHAFERPSGVLANGDFTRTLYGAISYAFDGLPYVGPVAVPPRCVEDPRRKRHIGALGKAIESLLANERGRRLCEGVGVGLPQGDEATEAQRWGIEVEKLREHIKEKTPPNMLNTLDDTFNEAVQQLLQWGGVFMGEDSTGKRFLAHKTPAMSWQCSARVKARQSWSDWWRSITGTMTLVMSIVVIRRRQAQKAIEKEQVAGLVTVALDSLRNQELAHHTDPVMVPRPYLSSLQLRDLVLQEIHDVSKRKRLWSHVERVVEANTNVRTNLQEVEGGDEQRVWQWVGSTGKMLAPGTPGIQRLDFGEGRIVA
ncbi:Man1-Src1p-C-terminal domain-containing protein [Daedaleopsis nitida]|nr:Man1-Src1p-C-terminal domain-containing protein [Daedaleopsis nitida]